MSEFSKNEWMGILSKLNSVLLRSETWRDELTRECVSNGWCGLPGASESEITSTESRLGVKLPHSYRTFLAVSNGWRPFNSSIERLLSAQQIERLKSADPEKLKALQANYRESDLSEKEYLDYEDSRNSEAMRLRYYPDSIVVGKGWGVEDDMILLNPQIVSSNGEWEAVFFAHWIPGNQRFRSFYDLVVDSVTFEESRSPR